MTGFLLPDDRPQPINDLPVGVAVAEPRTQVMLDVYLGTVLWDGQEREVEVIAKEGTPLIGMRLLDGCELCIQVTEGGHVSIQHL